MHALLSAVERSKLAEAGSASVMRLAGLAECNYYLHTDSVGGTVLLNATRFPHGGEIVLLYGYRRSGTADAWATSQVYGPTWIDNGTGSLGDPDEYYSNRSTILTTVEFVDLAPGMYVDFVEVAVRDEATGDWEYTATLVDNYINSGQYGASPLNGDYCAA